MTLILCDAGPRDGLQNEPDTFASSLRAELVNRLAATGLPRIEAASFVRDDRVPQMAGAEEVAAGIERRDAVEYAGLVINEQGFERLRQTELDRVNVTLGATDTFNRRNGDASLADATSRVQRILAMADRPTTATISVAFGCPFEGEVDPGAVAELRRELSDGAGVDLALEGTAEGDADRRRGGPVGHREDPLHSRRGVRERGVAVTAVEGVRRAKRDVDAVELGLPQPLEALLVDDEAGVLDRVAPLDPCGHLLGPGHLRHAVVPHEAGRLDPRQAGRREPVDELRAQRGRERVRLILKPVARAGVAENQSHLRKTVRADALGPNADEQPPLVGLRPPALARVLAR